MDGLSPARTFHTSVVLHRRIYLNVWYFQRVDTGSDAHTAILEGLNNRVIRIAVKSSHKDTVNQRESEPFVSKFGRIIAMFADVHRPMKKWVKPVRKAPTDMRKHPTAMSLGRWSLAPKWLTTARKSKLPTSEKAKRGE